ncbi:MAG: hypothetical protein NC231_10630 [Bacillus sp. (in: Bacteria)]|nr:hypothetical protein [Bacillus sp. (in: firmicutes)]MCM1425508.1 hypothetical protein [Eubacterium sp.]
MKKYKIEELDFLLVYEHKVRELENLCLIKYELDKRGYKTKIIHIEDENALKAMTPIYHAKVVVMMACYDNRTIEWHTKNYVKFDKLIDLQWENIVFPMDEKDKNAYKNYSGVAKDVVRVSWGEMNKKRMLETVGMDPKKVKLIGHVGMDFLRDELKGYYRSKEEVLKDYNIPVNKKIFLFISPYFSDSHTEEYLKQMCQRFGEGWRYYYQDCMLPSKKIILEWMSKICEMREDVVFVYRPHPGEESKQADEMTAKYSNFKVIGGESVKQWILVSDKIYTGNSSTFVEAFFGKKMCYLLFPISVPSDYELAFLKDADKISEFEDFEKTTHEDNRPFPVSEKLIDEVYTIDWDKPSYLKFADMAEEVLQNPYYNLTKEQLKTYYHKMGPAEKVTKALTKITPLYTVYLAMLENDRPRWKWLEAKREARRKLELIAHDYEKTSDEEIYAIITKIAKELEQ